MKLYPSSLFRVSAKDSFILDNKTAEEIINLADNISLHPFRNLVAVIYYNLKRNNCLRRLPSSAVSKLKDNYYNAVLLDMHQRGWLEKFIRKLLPRDITIILMKGSANWGTIYSPEAPRTGCDIDILVREKDFERIIRIMDGIGERFIIDESRLFTNFNAYEYSYKMKDIPVGVEIHRRISYPFVGKIDYDEMFKKSRVHPIYKDKRVRVMNPTERIVNTLIHSIKHADINAHEIVDTYRIIKRYKLLMEEIVSDSGRYGLSDYSDIFLRTVVSLTDGKGLDGDKRRGWPSGFKERIFNLLYFSDTDLKFRMRQLIAILLMDDFTDVLRFTGFYADLRVRDVLYNYLHLLTGKNYAK
ncbi:MAG: nucleotidyltransferase family protein [Deltaproteobacteria bacterium]|nr:nucleotidyltransferase family protein [Deltaproteobacteria bacterium]